MAKKKTFVLYADMIESIELLNMEQRGILLTAILCDQNEIDLPDMDALVTMAYSFVKRQLKANAEKYESTLEKRREAGKAGGLAKAENAKNALANASFAKQTLANASKSKQTLANLADSDSDIVTDTETDIVTGNETGIVTESDTGNVINIYSRKAQNKSVKDKPIKHKHGEYKNVLLTDEELASLQERFPGDWQTRIDNLSYYMSNHKTNYTSHYRTIRAWARNDQQKQAAPQKSKTAQELDNFYGMLDDWFEKHKGED